MEFSPISAAEPDALSKAAAMVEEFGIGVIEGFFSDDECQAMFTRGRELISDFDPSKCPVFTTDDSQKHQAKGDYFITSGDKLRFFLEEAAVEEATSSLTVEKRKSVNKIGHALAELDSVFEKLTFNERFEKLAKALGFQNPLVSQSMLIYKQPGVGGEVTPHQDSTFLYTDPPSVVGFWAPLCDATLENGCLWAALGSHKAGVYKRFVRNPDYPAGPQLVFTNDQPLPCKPEDYTPLPVKQGSLVIIHGAVIHKSEKNTSDKSREAYTVHIIEGCAAYAPENWLQRPDTPFRAMKAMRS